MSDEKVSKPNGLGVDPMQRLASFKPPRDYSLGASKPVKKVFTPNLNVTRNRNKGSSSNNTRDNKSNEKSKRERKNDRTKNFRNGPNVIKSGGVFAEGLGSAERHNNYRSSYANRDSDSSATTLRRPIIRVKDVVKIDKELEEQKIKMMMDRGSGELDEEDFKDAFHNEAPVILPMEDIGWSLSKRKSLVQLKKEVIVKTEPDIDGGTAQFPKMDIKPVLKIDPYDDTDVVDVLRAKSPALMLIKLPDTLPGRGVGDDDEPTRSKPGTEPSTSSKANEENTKTDNKCCLKQLEEGRIGKLLIRRSGRVTLKLGDSQFEVTLGTKSAFHQEVVSVSSNATSRSARLVSLGPLQHKLTVVPDWENLFLDLPS